MDQSVAHAQTEFGLSLLTKIAQHDCSGNIFLSPLSISLCLAMAANGAKGSTQAAILETLALADIPLEALNRASAQLMVENQAVETDTPGIKAFDEANRVLQAMVSSDEKEIIARFGENYLGKMFEAHQVVEANPVKRCFQISIANSLWGEERVTFKEAFLDIARNFYRAEIHSLDFRQRASMDAINAWISQATHGKINQVLAEPPQPPLVAVNAIYFRAFWRDQFRERNTREAQFMLEDGRQKPCAMMHREWHFQYCENSELQMVRLPYDDSETRRNIGMYILLPAQRRSMSQFLATLSVEKWEQALAQIKGHHQYGEVGLPRFQVEYTLDLTEILKAMGMAVAFDPQAADFSDTCLMVPNVWLSSVVHQAFVKVDEEGTEAGAVTVMLYAGGKFSDPTPAFHMIADRPFLYVIRDDDTGALLFTGVLLEP